MSLSNEKSSLGQREKAEMNNKTSQRYREKTNKSSVKNKDKQTAEKSMGSEQNEQVNDN